MPYALNIAVVLSSLHLLKYLYDFVSLFVYNERGFLVSEGGGKDGDEEWV